MICHVCGGNLERIITDFPFKTNYITIVIVKKMPVLQCENCGEYLIEDPVMEKIDTILNKIDSQTEVGILSYV
ncbi:MAG: type II toxin-antitoxin system MqsA family antitoxin [Candidatus Eremiobacterota bacterium]